MRRRLLAKAAVLVLAIMVVDGAWRYSRPLPALVAKPASANAIAPQTSPARPIIWPGYGQSAVGVQGYGALATSGLQKPLPTASVAKLITALVVLDKKPLSIGQAGPNLTVGEADIAIYNTYFAKGGSQVQVQLGERISQYDALEALLLPSANNVADMLATWAFGSVEAYTTAANGFAKAHGMTQTAIADASGFSPDTVSTADDLVRLGSLALQNPVVTEIVAKRSADIPVAGTIYNVNGLLGKYGINGLKTGNTDQAGGVFLVSADRQLAGGQKITVLATVMAAADLDTAMRATLPLLDSTVNNAVFLTAVKKGQVFGAYSADWQPAKVNVTASRDAAAVLSWQGTALTLKVELRPLSGPQTKGTAVGSVKVTANGKTETVPLVLSESITKPTARWRITR